MTYAGKALVEGTDYKVSYSNNYNVGTATVYITGYGNYVGSKKITFNITKRDITGYTAVLAQTDMTYTGNNARCCIDQQCGWFIYHQRRGA